MPSTVVHLALGALLAAALLGDEFDPRSLGLVMAVVAFPDLDTFVGIVLVGTHRAAFHTLLIPLAAAAVLVYDARYRDHSLARRFGTRGVRIAWVAVATYFLAGIGPDLFFNGVNLLYPVVDRFVALSGEVYLSNQRGLVQTIWVPAGEGSSVVGTTETVHYRTGVDPTRGPEPEDVERVFPVATSGLQLLLVVVASAVTTARLWFDR